MRTSVVRAARRAVGLQDLAVYAVVLAVLRVAFDASLELLAAIGVAFLALAFLDELRAEPGVNRHLLRATVALVSGVAVLAVLVVDGVSLPFLALLAGSAWLLYDAVSDYRRDAASAGASPSADGE